MVGHCVSAHGERKKEDRGREGGRKPKKKRRKGKAGINPVYEKMSKSEGQEGRRKDLSRIRVSRECILVEGYKISCNCVLQECRARARATLAREREREAVKCDYQTSLGTPRMH